MKSHVCVEDQPGDDLFGLLGVVGEFYEVALSILL